MAYGRHLSGVDPNDPCFWSRTPKFFTMDRARLRSCSRGGRSIRGCFFFFLWIIAYYYYYLAFRRHSAMIQPHGSTWITLDHKTYFSTMNYDPTVLTFWIIYHSALVGYAGSFFVSCKMKQLATIEKRQRQKPHRVSPIGLMPADSTRRT